MSRVLGLILLFSIAPFQAWADIYLYVDNDGVYHYTDRPKNDRYQKINGSSAKREKTNKGYPLKKIHRFIELQAYQNKVDPDLVRAVIMAESAFDPRALSKKGAMGLMQLMPETAEDLDIYDPYDPWENIGGGVRYLRRLLDRYKGNLDHSLAAYNAGETAVYRYGGIPPYRETAQYVKRVKRYYGQIKKGQGEAPLVVPL